MRKAEALIVTILLALLGSLASMYIEKEYNVIITIEKSFEAEEIKVKPYPDIIITDR